MQVAVHRVVQVEAAAPNFRQQLQEARAGLQGNLVVSAEAYTQLKKVQQMSTCADASLG
jgi:hypothetical protein